MKRLSLLVLGFLSAACFALAQPAASAVSKNLIFEGHFADHIGGLPAGWTQAGYAGGDHGNNSRVTEDREGNYVTLIIQNAAFANFSLSLSEPIALRPAWKALLCSVDMRVFNYEQGAQNYYKPRMQVTFMDETGKELEAVGVNLPGRYTDAWQTAERNIPIPPGATSAKVWIGTFGATGQIEFRSPYIAPVESKE